MGGEPGRRRLSGWAKPTLAAAVAILVGGGVWLAVPGTSSGQSGPPGGPLIAVVTVVPGAAGTMRVSIAALGPFLVIVTTSAGIRCSTGKSYVDKEIGSRLGRPEVPKNPCTEICAQLSLHHDGVAPAARSARR